MPAIYLLQGQALQTAPDAAHLLGHIYWVPSREVDQLLRGIGHVPPGACQVALQLNTAETPDSARLCECKRRCAWHLYASVLPVVGVHNRHRSQGRDQLALGPNP